MKNKWRVIVLLSGSILVLILLIGIALIIRNSIINQQRILFDVISSNGWPGSKSGGIFITHKGDIYQFEVNSGISWIYEWLYKRDIDPPYTTGELYQWYGLFPRYKGKIDTLVLENMVGKIEKVKEAKFVSRDSGCFDGGGLIFQAYVYNTKDRTHTPITLYSAGDYVAGKIDSDESKQLVEWLRKILLENGNVYGGTFEHCQP